MAETPDYIRDLGSYAANLTLDERLTRQAIKIVRDTAACIIAASGLPEIAGLRAAAPGMGGGGTASAVGVDTGLQPQIAALVNATAGVSQELDEGNQFTTNHAAAHIIPAVLATAEARGSSGLQFLTAFVAGYEVAGWIGHASRLRATVHPFGTHAITGGAAGCARLAGLDAAGIAAAIELSAGTALVSSQTSANVGASVRNAVTGLTAHNAVLVPTLLAAGITREPGASEVIFGKVLGEAFDSGRPASTPGTDPYILRNYFKVHACSRWNHAAIEATAAALEKRRFTAEDAGRIVVWTFDPAVRLAWQNPANTFAAKHSIPYNVAVRIVAGTNGIEAYTENLVRDPVVKDLCRRIEVREDPAYTRLVPAIRPARVEIRLRDGSEVTAVCEHAPGGFDRPFPDDVLDRKFAALAGTGLKPDAVAELDRLIAALPRLESVAPIGRLLRMARAASTRLRKKKTPRRSFRRAGRNLKSLVARSG